MTMPVCGCPGDPLATIGISNRRGTRARTYISYGERMTSIAPSRLLLPSDKREALRQRGTRYGIPPSESR